jgi:hypothetical protein
LFFRSEKSFANVADVGWTKDFMARW